MMMNLVILSYRRCHGYGRLDTWLPRLSRLRVILCLCVVLFHSTFTGLWIDSWIIATSRSCLTVEDRNHRVPKRDLGHFRSSQQHADDSWCDLLLVLYKPIDWRTFGLIGSSTVPNWNRWRVTAGISTHAPGSKHEVIHKTESRPIYLFQRRQSHNHSQHAQKTRWIWDVMWFLRLHEDTH